MRSSFLLSLSVCFILITGFKYKSTNEVELACVKTQKSTNTCHFNFKIDGLKYRFIDIGCKHSKNKAAIIEKAQQGKLALAKDWKLECSEVKEIKKTGQTDF